MLQDEKSWLIGMAIRMHTSGMRRLDSNNHGDRSGRASNEQIALDVTVNNSKVTVEKPSEVTMRVQGSTVTFNMAKNSIGAQTNIPDSPSSFSSL